MVNVVGRTFKAAATSLLARAFKEGAEGFVVASAAGVTIEGVRSAYASGKSVQEGLGMTEPKVQNFLVNAAKRCPWLLDEITYEVFIGWVAEGNPQLAAQVLGDPQLVQWGVRTWGEGVQELKRLAGLVVEGG